MRERIRCLFDDQSRGRIKILFEHYFEHCSNSLLDNLIIRRERTKKKLKLCKIIYVRIIATYMLH